VPFHLPSMNEAGFGMLISELTRTEVEERVTPTPSSSHIPSNVQIFGDMPSNVTVLGQAAIAPINPPLSVKPVVDLPESETAAPTAKKPLSLHSWEIDYLKKCHRLIRTPRGTKRLLNTYRLVRGGIPKEEWVGFCGDTKSEGEFRIAMLLQAAAAGYPAVAREWFRALGRGQYPGNSSEPVPGGNTEAWQQFNVAAHACIDSEWPSGDVLKKWINRVERFAF